MTVNWGTAVAAVYTAFAVSTAGFVAFAVGRPVSLVRADYYEQALLQDRRIAAVAQAAALGGSVTIVQDAGSLTVSLPPDQAREARGSLTLYRAADPSADRTAALRLDAEGRQRVPLGGTASGEWTLQLSWTVLDREFYLERKIRIE